MNPPSTPLAGVERRFVTRQRLAQISAPTLLAGVERRFGDEPALHPGKQGRGGARARAPGWSRTRAPPRQAGWGRTSAEMRGCLWLPGPWALEPQMLACQGTVTLTTLGSKHLSLLHAWTLTLTSSGPASFLARRTVTGITTSFS